MAARGGGACRAAHGQDEAPQVESKSGNPMFGERFPA